MALFEGFTLHPRSKKAQARTGNTPEARRSAMIEGIDKQIGKAKVADKGQKPEGQTWFTEVNGKVETVLKFANSILKFGNNDNIAVTADSHKHLIQFYEVAKKETAAGKLDSAITRAASAAKRAPKS